MNQLRTITYKPELNKITGSINATLLMCQLEYWFAKCSGQAFYKFLAPCEDPFYRTGDSWCEELGFSKPEFRNAFSRIGTVYKTKKEYTQSAEPFQGKLYLSYYDRIHRRTYYLRNDKLLTGLVQQLRADATPKATAIGDDTVLAIGVDISSIPTDVIITSIEPNTTANALDIHPSTTKLKLHLPTLTKSPEDAPRKSQTVSPIAVDYNKDLPTQITTRDDAITTDMHTNVLSLYHTLCPELPKVIALTPTRRHMIDSLLTTLGGSLSKIRTLFERVASSDFLCGRLPNKKWQALFDWIITSTNSLAILDGKYDSWVNSAQESGKKEGQTPKNGVSPSFGGLGDFDRPAMPTTRGRNAFTTMYTHNWDLDALEEIAYQHMVSQLG